MNIIMASTLLQWSTSLFYASSVVSLIASKSFFNNLISFKSFFIVFRLFRNSVWFTHLAQEGLGWVESGEEEEDLRGGGGMGGGEWETRRGGQVKGT
jgi:hypothetical protein